MYMNRKRKSIIWKISDEEFTSLVKNSKTMSELLRHFGMENKGGNFKTCKKRIHELNLDTTHFLNRVESIIVSKQITKEDLLKKLTINSCCNRTHLKKQLIKYNILKYECAKCKNTGIWENEKLTLQLEHKNGVSTDNRIENLEFLCPNCHSQTKTFAGRSLNKHKIKPSEINPNWRHQPKYKIRKVDRPSREILEEEIKENTMVSIGKKYGVSDNSIRKWCKSYGINLQ
jgi:Zn finger protein HypA/HybF involved in hydrogenase expression